MNTEPIQLKQMNRRQFLGTTTAAMAAFTIVPRHVLGGSKHVAPNDRLNIAVIGAGGQGRYNTQFMLKEPDAQIVAVCDPYEQWDRGAGGRKPLKAEIEKLHSEKGIQRQCNEYADFRLMLEKEKGIDAIMCATPDHLHALISIAAMKLGKHVYCEKPLTHNIWEARRVAQVAKETGVATQMGNMGHSGEGIRQTCEWIWAGAIGHVREVHAWGDAGRWVTRPAVHPKRRRFRRDSIGTCGWDRVSHVPIIPTTPRANGVAGGRLGAVVSATWAVTTSIPHSGL